MKISQPAGLNQETLVRMWAEYVYEGKMDSRIRPEIAMVGGDAEQRG